MVLSKDPYLSCRDLHRIIDEKNSQIEKLNSEVSMIVEELREETTLRKR